MTGNDDLVLLWLPRPLVDVGVQVVEVPDQTTTPYTWQTHDCRAGSWPTAGSRAHTQHGVRSCRGQDPEQTRTSPGTASQRGPVRTTRCGTTSCSQTAPRVPLAACPPGSTATVANRAALSRHVQQRHAEKKSPIVLTSAVHGPLTNPGFNTFCHRCKHCTSLRPGRHAAIFFQLLPSYIRTAADSCSSCKHANRGKARQAQAFPSLSRVSPSRQHASGIPARECG